MRRALEDVTQRLGESWFLVGIQDHHRAAETQLRADDVDVDR